jgi:CBS domain-containing protein
MSGILNDPVWKHIRRRMYFVGKDSSVAEAAKIMRAEHVGSVLVQDGAKAIGIITQRDIIEKVVADGGKPAEVRASSVMSSPLITVGKNDSLDKAMTLMQRNDIRRIVVLDNEGNPYGILVELRVCGDFLDRQYRKGDEKAKSWLEELIEDVTDHELEHSPEMEYDGG